MSGTREKTLLLTTHEVAAAIRCEVRLVRKLIRAGELRASNIAPGSKRPTFRVDAADLAAFVARTADGQASGKQKKRTRRTGDVIAFV
jgi:excisionase family DNA binding protein